MIILEIPVGSWWVRINKSILKLLFKIILISIYVFLFSLFFNIDFFIKYSFFALFGSMIMLILRLPNFSTYIYKIEKNLIITYFKYSKVHITKVQIKNFTIKYSPNPQGTPIFIFEQQKPYKNLFFQGCYGYWENKNSINIFLPYASSISFNEFKL